MSSNGPKKKTHAKWEGGTWASFLQLHVGKRLGEEAWQVTEQGATQTKKKKWRVGAVWLNGAKYLIRWFLGSL